MQLLYSIAVRSNLELKILPKQPLGSLLLDIALPATLLYHLSTICDFVDVLNDTLTIIIKTLLIMT